MNEGNNMPPSGNFPAIGDGEGEIPLAKQPNEKVDVRTMASDIASIQETGGAIPRPYTPGTKEKLGTLEDTAAAQHAFVQPTNPPVPPQTNAPQTDLPNVSKKKNPFGLILGIIVLIGLAAGIYFFVIPMLSTSSEKQPPVATETPLEGQTPQEEPTIPQEDTIVVPEVPENISGTPLPSGQTLEVHVSFLKDPADLVFDAKLSSFGLVDMIAPLEFTSTSIPVFKEIVFKTIENKPVSFEYIASRFFPSFFTMETVEKFQNDGTVFSYTDATGTWLGIIAKLKDGTPIAPVQDSMATLQKSPDLKNIFIVDPGAQGAWKDGKIAEKPSSLVSFSKNGATFSYTWFDRFLLIGTNINGSNEAAKRLGY